MKQKLLLAIPWHNFIQSGGYGFHDAAATSAVIYSLSIFRFSLNVPEELIDKTFSCGDS